MMTSHSVKSLACTLFAASLCFAQTSQMKTAAKSSSKSKAVKASTNNDTIHSSSLVVDTHADTTQRLLDEKFDLANVPAGDIGHLDFAKAKAGNLGAEFFSIWVEPK